MTNTAERLESDGPPCPAQTPHQLDLLMIKKEALVEKVDLPKRVHSKHHASARHPVDHRRSWRSDSNRRNPQQVIEQSCPRAARKLAAESREVKRAAGHRPIRLEQLASYRSGSRIVVKVFGQQLHGTGMDFCVWIED